MSSVISLCLIEVCQLVLHEYEWMKESVGNLVLFRTFPAQNGSWANTTSGSKCDRIWLFVKRFICNILYRLRLPVTVRPHQRKSALRLDIHTSGDSWWSKVMTAMLKRLDWVEMVLKAVHGLKLEWVNIERVPIPDTTREVVVWVSCATALWLLDTRCMSSDTGL